MKYKGKILDVVNHRAYGACMEVKSGHIVGMTECEVSENAPMIMPGFIDSHVHIESSMMTPAEFARVAVEHGTIGVVTDPHEIANVLGLQGIDFMIESSRQIQFNFCFGAPSCVPSCGTDIETSGDVLDADKINLLMARDDIRYLSEMMNYPGVLNGFPEVMAKIQAAAKYGKPIDGHAPGVVGADRAKYAGAGISTDHECSTIEEARACIDAGMMVLIREGSAAKNYDALKSLIKEAPDKVMFCTDDCHPSDLVRGHINNIVFRAIMDGFDVWDVLQAACVNPQRHYDLDWGLLRVGDRANFIIIEKAGQRMRVRSTFIDGVEVFRHNSFVKTVKSQSISLNNQMAMLDKYPNRFVAASISAKDIALNLRKGQTVDIIVAKDGCLLTGHDKVRINGNPLLDAKYPWHEVQKIVVYNRYVKGAKPIVGLVRGFNVKDGAMAGSVAHDCHNIVAVGSSDEYLVAAINRIIEMKGGQVAISGYEVQDIPLPIAGLISPLSGHEIAYRSSLLEETIAEAGCKMKAPFITMAFMCLPVIPALKLTDKGLFDSEKFEFI